MSIRMLPWVLLIGASCAYAAPPEKAEIAPTNTAPTTTDIDVDALARAKDVDANTATNAANATDAASTNAEQSAPVTTNEPAPSAPEEASAEQAAPAVAADPSTVPMSPQAPTAEAPEVRLAAACEARATALLDAAQKGDYAAATSDFDAKMRSALPVAKFKAAWESLAQFGTLQARGQSHPATGEGYLVVTTPLIFEKKNLYAQVACGSDGRIAGFFVKPLEIPAK